MNKYSVRKPLDQEKRNLLQKYSDVLAHLLYYRDIKDQEGAENFLSPDYENHTHDPYLLKDMDRSVSRIIEAVDNNQKIFIYSDYDADGIPGAVILKDFFKKINYKNFEVYIPHRVKEGFGFHPHAIEYLKDNDASLVITVDCGITDHKAVELANKNNIDVIITDHHTPHDGIPNAYAVINPKREDCNYPEKMLCGAAVAFKLVQALVNSEKFEIKKGWEKWLLDMVGVATLSDMVPLQGENRVLAHYGLLVLRKTPRLGIRKLLSKRYVNQNFLTETDVVFTITPKINAASRMGCPHDALNLLSEEDEDSVNESLKKIESHNNKRKGQVAGIVKEAKHMLDKSDDLPVVVLGHVDWSPSLLGLAAQSLSDTYSKPVFLWGRGEGESLKGSCRGGGFVNVVEVLKKVPESIVSSFGGHDDAGGFVVTLSGVDLLSQSLNDAYKNLGNTKSQVEKWVDMIFDDVLLNDSFILDLKKLRPFGVGNEDPIWLFSSLNNYQVNYFGKNKEHLEISFDLNNKKVRAIYFYCDNDDWKNILQRDFSIVGNIEESYFKGKKQIQIRIIDIIPKS